MSHIYKINNETTLYLKIVSDSPQLRWSKNKREWHKFWPPEGSSDDTLTNDFNTDEKATGAKLEFYNESGCPATITGLLDGADDFSHCFETSSSSHSWGWNYIIPSAGDSKTFTLTAEVQTGSGEVIYDPLLIISRRKGTSGV